MKITYIDNKLYIDIEERINFSLIKKLKYRLFHLIDSYAINDIELNIIGEDNYDTTLIQELLNDYNRKYNGKIIVK